MRPQTTAKPLLMPPSRFVMSPTTMPPRACERIGTHDPSVQPVDTSACDGERQAVVSPLKTAWESNKGSAGRTIALVTPPADQMRLAANAGQVTKAWVRTDGVGTLRAGECELDQRDRSHHAQCELRRALPIALRECSLFCVSVPMSSELQSNEHAPEGRPVRGWRPGLTGLRPGRTPVTTARSVVLRACRAQTLALRTATPRLNVSTLAVPVRARSPVTCRSRPARVIKTRATICMELCPTPVSRYREAAVATTLVWLRQLNVTESRSAYARCRARFCTR